jgi:large subunit ribosomal protein L6e
VIVKQLSSGLLLVTGKNINESLSIIINFVYLGPSKLNGVSLRRVNQIYVIATSTKLDLSSATFDNLDDKFFKRVRPTKKNAEKDIFDSKKEVRNRNVPLLILIFDLSALVLNRIISVTRT